MELVGKEGKALTCPRPVPHSQGVRASLVLVLALVLASSQLPGSPSQDGREEYPRWEVFVCLYIFSKRGLEAFECG